MEGRWTNYRHGLSLRVITVPRLQGLSLFVALPLSLDSPNTTFAKKELNHLSFLECWHLKFVNFCHLQNIDRDIVIFSIILFNDFNVAYETKAINHNKSRNLYDYSLIRVRLVKNFINLTYITICLTFVHFREIHRK